MLGEQVSAEGGLLLIGTGAVASFLLPRLLGAGHTVQLFGSPSPRLHALSKLAPAVSDPALLARHDGWLVCCKGWQNSEKVRMLAQVPRPRRILVLQNGLEPELGWQGLAPLVERGLCTYGLASTGPGQVVGGEAGELLLPAGSPWLEILRPTGLELWEREDMAGAIWWKLVVNASLNVVAALDGLLNGQVLESFATRTRLQQAAREVAAVGCQLGMDTSSEDAVAVVERVATLTADNVCSTLSDLRRGRPTEYDSINGALLRLARLHGLSTPVLDQLDHEFRLLQTGWTSLEAVS
jgi:2-dehydropantoate 2-reductase